VTKINSVAQYQLTGAELNWALRLGASCLPSVSLPGTSVPAAGPFATLLANPGLSALPRVRGKVAVLVPQAQKVAVTALVDQTNIHNYMTGVSAVSGGASGPPREKEPV